MIKRRYSTFELFLAQRKEKFVKDILPFIVGKCLLYQTTMNPNWYLKYLYFVLDKHYFELSEVKSYRAFLKTARQIVKQRMFIDANVKGNLTIEVLGYLDQAPSEDELLGQFSTNELINRVEYHLRNKRQTSLIKERYVAAKSIDEIAAEENSTAAEVKIEIAAIRDHLRKRFNTEDLGD